MGLGPFHQRRAVAAYLPISEAVAACLPLYEAVAAFLPIREAVAAYLPIMHVEAAEGGRDAKLERDDGKMDHDL